MNAERFKVTGKRLDNRKTVSGNYLQFGENRVFIEWHGQGEQFKFLHEVDPATIQPVALKPRYEPKGETIPDAIFCPNCETDLMGYFDNPERGMNYCPECGQRLNWMRKTKRL